MKMRAEGKSHFTAGVAEDGTDVFFSILLDHVDREHKEIL
jgi:hypothetical protein